MGQRNDGEADTCAKVGVAYEFGAVLEISVVPLRTVDRGGFGRSRRGL